MEKHPVALIPIATYDQAAVDTAVLQGVDLLGGIARFVQPEERILLKPNLLSRALPQKAITTHPAVFSAVCRLLHESGYTHLSYGDSPGNPTTSPDKAARHPALRRPPSATAWKWRISSPAVSFPSPTGTRQSRFTSARACRMPTR